MDKPKLYRRRFIPDECIHLKDDVILYMDDDIIVTSWTFLKPKVNRSHAYSVYYLNRGYKVSRVYDNDNNIIFWYCDIIDTVYNNDDNSIIFNDLLADVVYYPDGKSKVLDLDEVAEAMSDGLVSDDMIKKGLLSLSKLLKELYAHGIESLDAPITRALSENPDSQS